MSRVRRRNAVSPAEIASVMAVSLADQTSRGARDAAGIAILCGLGLSPAQISSLDREDYDAEEFKLRLFRGTAAERWLRLPSQVHTALANWISARGSHPGALLHPITRPDRIVMRRFSKANFSHILAMRTEEADVVPFSPDDVARTHSLLLCGQWKANCCCVLPADDHCFPIAAIRPLEVDKARAPVSATDPWHPPIVRYLAHLIPRQRAEAREILDALAQALGGVNALVFPWEKLCLDELPTIEALRHRFGHSALSKAKRALNGVIREAVFLGLMSPSDHLALRDVSWNRVKSNPWVDACPAWEAIEPLFSACIRGESSASKRDGGLFGLIWAEQIGVTDAISFPNSAPAPRLRIAGSSRPLPEIVKEAIIRWQVFRGSSPGPFLTNLSRSGDIVPVPMSADAVESTFRRCSSEAGIDPIRAEELRRMSIKYHFGLQDSA
jgi:hypothetical protein